MTRPWLWPLILAVLLAACAESPPCPPGPKPDGGIGGTGVTPACRKP